MNEKVFADLRAIKKAISSRKLVVFAGAGISNDAGVPSWQLLVDEMKNDMSVPKGEDDFLRIAQMYYNDRQEKEFIDKVREVLGYKKLRHNEIHEALFELNPEHILTTNFDDLLEQVIRSKAYPFTVIKKDSDLPYSQNSNLLLKIHGDLEERNIVLKEDDFLEFETAHPLIAIFMKSIFASKVVLFVGYSFSDINLKIILQSVRNILGKDFQNAYLLSIENNLHPTKREYLKKKGINILCYSDFNLKKGDDFIERYLQENNALNTNYFRNGKSLKKEGQRLFNFLRFINNYDVFSESVKTKNIVEQMYLSLKRFDELTSLPNSFIGNIYPFNASNGYIHSYYYYTLRSNNDLINKFFLQQLDKQDLKPIDEFFESNSINSRQRVLVNEKVGFILRSLNFASILFFGKTDGNQKFDYSQEADKSIDIRLKNLDSCDCLICTYNNFNLADFLKKLNNQTISETSELKTDLLIAYSNYKAGNFVLSFEQYEEIGNKAWQMGKYLTYFIAKSNSKSLYNLIKSFSRELSASSKKDLLDKILAIDMNKIVASITGLDRDTYRLINIIMEDQILEKAKDKIDEQRRNIIKTYDQYKDGGFSMGPQYYKMILHELFNVYSFYNNNYIIKDEFSEFQNVMKNGFEALLINYATDDNYPDKIRKIDKELFKLFVLYGDAEDFKKITSKYRITELEVNDNEIPEIVLFINNLLTSIFQRQKLLNDIPNAWIETQLHNYFFANRVRKYLNNMFLISSGIKLPAHYLKDLSQNLIGLLEVEEILDTASISSLLAFLSNIYETISFETFIKFIEISTKKEKYVKHKDFIRTISYLIHLQYPHEKIENRFLIDRILNLSGSNNSFMYLWKIADDYNKRIIEDRLRSNLNLRFDFYNFMNATYEGVLFYEDYLEKFIEEAKKSAYEPLKWEGIKPNQTNFVFINLVIFIYCSKIPFNHPMLKSMKNLPEHWRFYLNPISFDYSKFDYRWLLLVENEEVYKRLRKITPLKAAIKKALKRQYIKEIADIYSKYFL